MLVGGDEVPHQPYPVGVAVAALAAGWLLWWTALHPAWQSNQYRMTVFFLGLLILIFVLIWCSPLFGIFGWSGYIYVGYALPGWWRNVGGACVAVGAAISQVGGYAVVAGMPRAAFGVLLAVNVVISAVMIYVSTAADDQAAKRAETIDQLGEANARLEAALRENAGLHAQLLAQAREAGVLDERQRMAGEIHDVLAQGLTGIVTQLEAAEAAALRYAAHPTHRPPAPHSAPEQSPHSAPEQSPYPTPRQAAHFAPRQAAHFAPQQVVHPAPRQPGHSAPQQVVDSAPQQVVHLAAREAGHSAPPQVTRFAVEPIAPPVAQRVGQPAARSAAELADPPAPLPADWLRHLENAKQLARESLSEARRSVQALRPQTLDAAALPEAIGEIVTGWSDLSGVPAELITTGAPRPLLPEIEATLLRTAQEALANVARHAAAGRVALTLSYMEDVVTLDVRDDGAGFDPAAPPTATEGSGYGLAAMRERLLRIAGSLEVESEPGHGTALSACVPAITIGAAA
jgi:signal transduction histidine kinase